MSKSVFSSGSSSIESYVQGLIQDRDLGPDVVAHRIVPPVPGRTVPLQGPLSDPVADLVRRAGVDALYGHQAEGIAHVLAGRNPVLATPTASGKSLVYNASFLEARLADSEARALYVFPLKALAQDQLKTFTSLAQPMAEADRPDAATYDGDTGPTERTLIRRRPPAVVFTNPEMIHLSFLAHHQAWKTFFQNLRLVVLDEVHTYRGILGSNMAWVFRRLLRVCSHYGSSPCFVFCSATIANPAELCSGLSGLPVQAVTESTAPSPRKHFLLVNGQGRTSSRALRMLHSALVRQVRTIVYTQSRKMAELISLWAGQRDRSLRRLVSPYRAGFLAEERRSIEDRLSRGKLLAVVSTSALELGIDIGGLDLCLLVGYPGSIMATWQRAGRVGRGDFESATVFIGHEDPLDQYFMRHPDRFFDMEPEAAVINILNPTIMARHLECAAAELMIEDGEEMIGLPEIRKCLAGLIQEGRLLETDDGVGYVSRSRHPQREVDLRGAGSEFSIHDVSTGELIGSMDRHRAWHEAHPGAVYVHQGRTHVVQDLDVDSATILVEADDPKHYTRALSAKTTRILRTLESRALGSTSVHLGRVLITERVTGYEKRSTRTGRLVGREDLDLPPLEFETEGLWVIVPEAIQSKLERDMLHFMGGIHALEHALIAMMPLFVLTDRNDLGGISVPCHDQLGQAAVFVYDGVPGGAGLTRAGFAKAREILEHTLEAVSRCPCTFGCPSCVHSPRCGSGNRPLDKEAAQAIMRGMLAPGTAVQFSEVAIPENEPEIPAPSKAVSRIRFGVFDLETRHSAHEVGGWGRPEAMGVSCAVLYDSGPDRFTTYMAEDIPALVEDLRSLDLVVGFNIIRFDYRVLQGYSQFPFRDLPTLDILAKVQERLGYRLSLGHLAQYTLNAAKSADGLQALKWWKQGRIREIVEYCTQDVAVTRDLYLHGRDKGHLVFQNKAGLQVSLPVSW